MKRYREWGVKHWHDVTCENLAEHLGALYANHSLILFGEDDTDVPSTISQPSFVLWMLDRLQLEPGHRVFELGAGSGWNAAMIGELVGARGEVHSLEIIPEIARAAAQTVAELEFENVHIIEGDGSDGYAAAAPYDRVVFTAGTYDLPHPFYDQLNDGGLLLIVIKTEGGGDNLFLLRKCGDHFESLESTPCGFVQVRGKREAAHLEPRVIEQTIMEWPELKTRELNRRPFWWGAKGRLGFEWATAGIRSFLGITEPLYRSFKTEKLKSADFEYQYFGLWDAGRHSLVLAADDQLVTYGEPSAGRHLLDRIRQWTELGMPSASSFNLKVFPIGVDVTAGKNQWLVKRSESQFLWSL